MTAGGAEIIRGRLSDAEKARIEALAGAMETVRPGPIARAMNRHVDTVKWYLLQHGWLERTLQYGGKPNRRSTPFTPDEDARLVALRREGLSRGAVAAQLAKEFGRHRSASSVRTRLAMLAAYDGGPEE